MTLQVRYRPVRIGWCVQEGNLEQLRMAWRLTHTLWGGRYNPVVPLGDMRLARYLVKTFQVDCLYPLSADSAEAKALVSEFEYLMWPDFQQTLFEDGFNGKVAAFLDIYHPIRHLHGEHIKDNEHPKVHGTMYRWAAADPLADLLLATFGGYPTNEEIGKDYGSFFIKYLAATEEDIGGESAVPATAFSDLTPSTLTGFDLTPDYRVGRHGERAGIYYGASADFTDLVNYWNLRASGSEALFYDPAFSERLSPMTNHLLTLVREAKKPARFGRDEIVIWNKSYNTEVDTSVFGPGTVRSQVSADSWNGLNIHAALMGFEEQSVLGTVSENGQQAVTFELPEKPFFNELELHSQKVVVSVHPLVTTDNVIFRPPFCPKLNEYYGREAYFLYNAVRSEHHGLGIIVDISTKSLTLHALETRTLVKKIFETHGIAAKPSPAGLVGLRLIEQMGGVQGCRVFKIAGVRNLIKDFPPDRSFTRSAALMKIGQVDPQTGKPNFSKYERLFIEYREGTQAKPEHAFQYLLKCGVFRPGLRLVCPHCELENWFHLDEARAVSKCEYCGRDFNVATQLRDRDWAYRRSGLFGRDDNQGGGIPVALLLQQVHTALHDHIFAFTTGTELEPIKANIQKCESDFVILAEALGEPRLQVAIGECKGQKTIETDDVTKLGRVADVLDAAGDCDVFVLFAKTSTFTPEEIERCKAIQGQYRRRVIMLSDRELEPYFIYEATRAQLQNRTYANSFADMANATHVLYFSP